MADEHSDALAYIFTEIIDAEVNRKARALVNSLFYYDPRRDAYVLKNPDRTEYTRQEIERMAGS